MSLNPYRTAAFPASHAQENLWFLNELNSGSQLAYTIALRGSIDGSLNALRLQQAVNHVVATQEILRTSFAYAIGELRQIVSPSATLPIHTVDCISDDESLQRLIHMEVRRGWSLKSAPLYRLLLIKTGEKKHELIVCTHHIVCDGISLQLLLKHIVTAYQTHNIPPASIDDKALQFADYAVWSKQHTHAGVDYWRKQLANAPTTLNISPRLSWGEQQFAGARIPLAFASAEWQSLLQNFINQGISNAAVFLAAYSIVLHRLAEQDDILIGVPISNRLRPELAQVIGYLSNMCVFRSHYAGDQSITSYLHQVQLTLSDLIEHGETPFQQVLHAVEYTRQSGMTPLFQVLFGYEQDVQLTIETDDLQLILSEVDTGAARLDLSLFLFEDHAHNVNGFLEYATDRFDGATAKKIAHMLTKVLREFVAASQAQLSAVRLGPGDSQIEAEELTPSFLSVPARILTLAESQPTAIALCDDRGELTFAQLGRQIAQAAATLRNKGARVGTPIAVIGERGISWVITLLSIWQVGGIYVPLSTSLPEQRLRDILAELNGAILIADSYAPDNFIHIRTLAMASLWTGTEAPEEYPATDVSALSGYMMFTSGSTGKPKGVQVSQANLVAALSAFGQLLKVTPNDRMLALTTFSFDISLLELLLTLVNGGSVFVAATQAQRDGKKFANYLTDPKITLAQATPTSWMLLLSAGWRPRKDLTMLCGGEPLPQDLADRLCLPSMALWNLYGPTETTIWSTAYRMCPGAAVQLGYPIPGTRVAVVDQALHTVPRGMVGELMISGTGVSQGYYGNAVETAKKYLPHPNDSGTRAYLTGDMVRMLQDGSLVYVGRRDDQIKLRGHRIELGEIEVALRALPGVQDAAVQLSGKNATGCIQAFIQLSSAIDDTQIDIGLWLDTLCQTLPEAWIPTQYYQIERIPLTANGKRDKTRLSTNAIRLGAPSRCITPRNDTEAKVQRIWCDLLNIEHIGVTDDFFQLGGHSILVARMVELVESAFGRYIPIADVYVDPTIARVAATLDCMTSGEEIMTHGPNGDWEFMPISRQDNVPAQES